MPVRVRIRRFTRRIEGFGLSPQRADPHRGGRTRELRVALVLRTGSRVLSRDALKGVLLFLIAAAPAAGQRTFHPTATHVLGSSTVGAPLPLARVFTQEAGEVAMKGFEIAEHGLLPNLPVIARVLKLPRPVVNVMTLSYGQETIHASGVVNFARSRLPFELLAELTVTGGNNLTLPVGARLATFRTRVKLEDGKPVLLTRLELERGILPRILGSPLSISAQQTPGVVRNSSRAGRVTTETTFISVPPARFAEPLSHSVRQEVEIGEGSPRAIERGERGGGALRQGSSSSSGLKRPCSVPRPLHAGSPRRPTAPATTARQARSDDRPWRRGSSPRSRAGRVETAR